MFNDFFDEALLLFNEYAVTLHMRASASGWTENERGSKRGGLPGLGRRMGAFETAAHLMVRGVPPAVRLF